MKPLIVIPARMASTRFPGKPLALLAGKPMVQWVWEACLASEAGSGVVVAAPDEEIVQAARKFGAEAVLTSDSHRSGTDRLAEVARLVPAEAYINVQGDEPLVEPATIRRVAEPLAEDPEAQMASVHTRMSEDEAQNPAVVKVALDLRGRALYFSRSPIPYAREARQAPLWRHVGLYAFRRDVLLDFAGWAPTPLEMTESLEQLRFLEHGVAIHMREVEEPGSGVDTPEQAEAVRRILEGRSPLSG
jgi:3-deoxy-manno-octulosonate cytidylyltransferase (CMP-KDO synthetase)